MERRSNSRLFEIYWYYCYPHCFYYYYCNYHGTSGFCDSDSTPTPTVLFRTFSVL